MNVDPGRLVLTLAGREVPNAWDRVRRYCGLTWSGGVPEIWAFAYYDRIESDPGDVGPVDVIAAGALHPGLSREDLAFFSVWRDDLNRWIGDLPVGVPLCEADDLTVERLVGLCSWPGAPNLGLLTKVLHRKRSQLIPLVDREVIDWYRPLTGERSATAAWPGLVAAMRHDLVVNADALGALTDALVGETGTAVSALRLVDIVIWMGAAR